MVCPAGAPVNPPDREQKILDSPLLFGPRSVDAIHLKLSELIDL